MTWISTKKTNSLNDTNYLLKWCKFFKRSFDVFCLKDFFRDYKGKFWSAVTIKLVIFKNYTVYEDQGFPFYVYQNQGSVYRSTTF